MKRIEVRYAEYQKAALFTLLMKLGIKSARFERRFLWDPNANGGQGEEYTEWILS